MVRLDRQKTGARTLWVLRWQEQIPEAEIMVHEATGEQATG